MDEYIKKNFYCLLVIIMMLVASGVLLLFSSNAEMLIKIITFVIGGIIIVAGIALMIINIKNNKYIVNSSNKFYDNPVVKVCIQGTILIILGLLIIIFPTYWVRLAFAIFILIAYCVKLCLSDNKFTWFKKNILTLFLILILVLSIDMIMKYVLLALSILLLLVLSIYLIVQFIIGFKNKDKNVLLEILYKFFK